MGRGRCWDIWGWDVGKGRVGCGGHRLGGIWGYLMMRRVGDREYLGTERVEDREPPADRKGRFCGTAGKRDPT